MSQFADFVLETTMSEGLGDMSLEGPPDAKFRPWRDAFGDGDDVWYSITQTGVGSEVGLGRLVHGTPDRVVRVSVSSSTNSGSFVNWPAGRKTVHSTVPAADLQVLASGLAVTKQTITVLGVLSTPPGGPTVGDVYLVGDAPTGAWSSFENEVVRWTGYQWLTLPTVVGDSVVGPIDPYLNTGDSLAYRSSVTGGVSTFGLWHDSEWRLHARPGVLPVDVISLYPISGSKTMTVGEMQAVHLVSKGDPTGATITLPPVGFGAGNLSVGGWVKIINISTGAGVVTVVGSSSQTINGAASYVIPNTIGCTTFRAVDLALLGTHHWFVE